jgi:uncharacterized protein
MSNQVIATKQNKSNPMKSILLFAFVISITAAFGQSTNPLYDSTLAKKLGADNYGMKKYVLVILTSGSQSTDKATRDSLFAGHLQNIKRLAELRKLIVAGPLEKNDKDYRGIFILDVPMEEAEELMDTDPAIHAKLLHPNLFSWYGSAALPVYLDESDKIWKEGF